jgi:thioredoxin
LQYSQLKIEIMVQHLTNESFKEKVFNYTDSKDWKFEGNKPAVIDFYADWCGPCKMVAPILDELATEFDGKIDIYKVDTETERELAGAFGIQSIPSILFIPQNGQPQMAQGALPKDSFIRAFKDVLKVEK